MTLHAAWTITGTVDDLYRPGAITAAADDSLDQIAARLQDKDISALVILDGYRLAGIITERDIVCAVADRRDLADVTAGDYMTVEPATVNLETPLAEVARTMLTYDIRHLPVVVAGDVPGMVSARDLLELESATTHRREEAAAALGIGRSPAQAEDAPRAVGAFVSTSRETLALLE
jgi:CBS domain-containing protein